MMKKLILTAMALGLGLASNPAYAEKVEEYTFDTVHTQILFFVSHIGFSVSEGEFIDFGGHYNIDREHPENSSVEVIIDTSSIDMDDEKWDDHMKNKDFFNVEKFPEMTFKSTAVKVTGENTAEVIGDLTLLGVTKPVTLNVTHNKTDFHPYSGKMVSGFSATAQLKRSEFGMTYGLPGVGDDVEIRIEVEGILKEEEER